MTFPFQKDGKPYCNRPCYAALFGPKGILTKTSQSRLNVEFTKWEFIIITLIIILIGFGNDAHGSE